MKSFRTFMEAKEEKIPTSVKGRVEYIIAHPEKFTPEVNVYVQKVMASQTYRELWELGKSLTASIPSIRSLPDLGDESMFGMMLNLKNYREDQLRKAEKDAKKASVSQRKHAAEQKKQAVQVKVNRGLALPALQRALEEIGADFWKEVHDSINSQYDRKVDRYFTDGAFNLKRPDAKKASRAEFSQYDAIKSDMAGLMMQGGKLNPEWKALVEKWAKDTADLVTQRFKNKMALKIGEVVDRKGGDAQVEKTGSVGNHLIKMAFTDGSSFMIKTQQVLAVSVLGNLFARYPTTFHNVKFHDGTFMKTPSAEKFHTEFGISSKISIDSK